MKRLIVLFFITYQLIGKLCGQSVFYPQISSYTNDQDEWYIDALALNDRGLVLLGATSENQTQSQALFIQKIDLAGNVVFEKKFPLNSDSIYKFCNLFYRNGLLEVYGYAGKLKDESNSMQHHNVILRYVLDTSFNLLSKEVISLPIGIDISIMYGRFKRNSQDNIYGALQVLMENKQVPLNPFGNFYFTLDSTSSKLKNYLLDTVQYQMNDLVGFEIHQLSSSKYLSVKGVRNKDANMMSHHYSGFDSDLNKIPQTWTFSDQFTPNALAGPFANLMESKDTTTFYLAGTAAIFYNGSSANQSFFIAELKLDSSLAFFPNDRAIQTRKVSFFSRTIGSPGLNITQVPSYFQCLDRNKKGEFVFGGMVNHRMEEYTLANDLVADTLSFVLLNEDLSIKKQNSFFNNEQITLNKVMYLQDGSIIAIGFTRDYIKNPQNLTRDLFAIKLTSEGELTTGSQVMDSIKKKLEIYPNPSTTSIRISCPFEPKYYQLINSLGETIVEDNPTNANFFI